MNLQNVLVAADEDSTIEEILRTKPSEIFLPTADAELSRQFDDWFSIEIAPFVERVDQNSRLEINVLRSGAPSAACAACKVGAFSIAALIVALGAAGLATLSATSAVVVQLAAFAGVSTTVALAFIVSLGATIAGGISEVVNAICDWTSACP